MPVETLTWLRRGPPWGLARPAHGQHQALRRERGWRLPMLLALMATIPAFYGELITDAPPWLSPLGYLLAALVTLVSLLHVAAATTQPMLHLRANPIDLLLIIGLMVAATLPSSASTQAALSVRGAVAGLTLWRLIWTLRPLLVRGSVAYLLGVALAVLVLCGAGFWWLEPTVHNLGDGLWLAFTTAATVGYGDIVPTTSASKIFSVFVVLLGYGVLSLVTAAIAAAWVETGERQIELERAADLRHELAAVRSELSVIAAELAHLRAAQQPSAGTASARPRTADDLAAEDRD